jgi:hypothetical protein
MRTTVLGATILMGLSSSGCISMDAGKTSEAPLAAGAGLREDTRMTQVVLDQLCMAFGERYVTAIGNACNQVEAAEKELEPKAKAHNLKLRVATSVYDILTGPNPFAKLMDLILLVELEYRVRLTDKVAGKEFGPEAVAPLLAALSGGRDDVWAMADKVLKPEERKTLETMIDDWRAKNPSAEAVAFVRFNAFSEYRGKSILDNVPLGSGLLAPVSEATRQLEETRMLAERGMFLAKRFPMLIRWNVESLLYAAFRNPEVRRLAEAAERAVAVAEAFPAKVAEERAIILKTLDEREKTVGGIVRDVRATATDVKEIARDAHALLKETDGVMKAADSLIVKLAPSTPPQVGSKEPHPFDIREYAQTIRDGLKALEEMRGLLESSAWTLRLTEVNEAAQSRITQSSGEVKNLVDAVFWRASGLIGLLFVLGVASRVILRRAGPASPR